jgi:biotin synthase-like enzyme
LETFELYLSPIDAKRFKVIVTKSPVGEGETETLLPFFEDKIDWRGTLIKTLETTAAFKLENFPQPSEQKLMVKFGILNEDKSAFHPNYLVNIGQALFRALFPSNSKVEKALIAAERITERKNTQLHIQLKFEADVVQRSRLADYPWELLHDGHKFLFERQVTISRYIAHDTVPPNLNTVQKVNVLLVSSAAFDLEQGLKRLSKKEQQAVHDGLQKASDAGLICLVELEYATVNYLRAYLTEHRGEDAPHVLHFDGHGLFGKRCLNPECQFINQGIKLQQCHKCNIQLPEPQGYLLFENDEDKLDYISAADLGNLLWQSSFGDDSNTLSGVRLVVLSACQSAMAVAGDSIFNGTAQNLISHRIPAVVAMQYSVGVKAATQFAEQFYRSLGQKDSLAVAINKGREAMRTEINQWYRPVLYLRWRDNEGGRLFTAPKPATRIGVPFQAPPLPTYYVERPEYSQELKTRLLTELEDVRTLAVTAIHGLGSVGKSTLAAALAHDEEVQKHFYDGILWATLGQQPNLLSLLSGWVQALGDYKFKATSVEAASMQLRTLLRDKAVLLVVDDAWINEDKQDNGGKFLEAFKIGGARCRMLVTTRNASIANFLSAKIYWIDVMTETQALELLTKKLEEQGKRLQEDEIKSAQTLAKAVGYLPLALELAASQVVSGTSWQDLIRDIQQEIARLRSFQDPGIIYISKDEEFKKLSLQASLNLSVKRLKERERGYFAWLGVLPEDASITPRMTATLWDMDERNARENLQYFQSQALLSTGVPLVDRTPTYRLHDLLHALARNLLIAPPKPILEGDLPGLGITLPIAHATLLKKYRKKTCKNLWHTLPNDGYIHQHLVWHLEKAQKVEEIHSLLREDSETGSNGWYEACDRLGQTANFITDVVRVWQLAEESYAKTTQPQEVIGLQCRYALILASLNSLAANLPVKLLIALVQKKVWTSEQGLAYVLQSSNPADKANLLTQLANHLPSNLKELALSKALAAARAIQDESPRAEALSALADKKPELLLEALAAAKQIQSESLRAKILSALADKKPELLPEALVAAKQIQSESLRAEALSLLADKKPELLPEALVAAKQIQSEYSRAKALSALADKLPPELLPEALVAAEQIQSEYSRYSRAQVLSALAKQRPELLPEALVAAKQIQDESLRAEALSLLAVKLPPELLPEALVAAKQIQSESLRAKALSALADKLPPELLPEALAVAKQIQDEYSRAKVLITLANQRPELLPEALAAAEQIQNEYSRAEALRALAKQRPELLPEALAAAKQIQDEFFRAQVLSALANQLPPELLPEALVAAKQIQSEYSRAQVLSALANQLPPELLPEALVAAKQIQDEYSRAEVLSALANQLSPELLQEALAAAKQIQDESFRAEVLTALANQLPKLLQEALAAAKQIQDEYSRAEVLTALADKLPPELLQEALFAAKQIQSESFRAKVLSTLANQLPPELLPQVLAAAKQIQNKYNRAEVLSALANQRPELLSEALAAVKQIQEESLRAKVLSTLGNQRPELLSEALAAAKQIQQESLRAEALSALGNQLPPKLLPEALAAAKQIQSESLRAKVLSALGNQLPPELLPEALAAAKQIQSEYSRAEVLSALGNQLPPELLPEALAAAKQIQEESLRAKVLSALANQRPELLPEALAAAKQIQSESRRAEALSALGNQLPLELLPELLAGAKQIQDESSRAKVLSALANQLPPELLPEALAAAKQIQDESRRAKALSALAIPLSRMPTDELFSCWKQILHELSLCTRQNLLRDIEKLVPVIYALGSDTAIASVNCSIQKVARWWH